MSAFDIKIDPKSAEQGAAKVVKSFESIEKAANRLAKDVGPKFTKLKNEVSALSKLQGPNAQLSAKLRDLSDALKGLKAPSPQAVKNIKALFAAISGIKGPNPAAISSLAALKSAIQGFTAPSAVTVKNLRALFSALASMKSPANIQSIVVGLGQIATAARRANSAVSQLGASLRAIRPNSLRVPGLGGAGLGGGSGGAGAGGSGGGFGSGRIKSLGGDFRILRSESLSLSAALLRTQVALQSLFAVMGIGKVIDVAVQFQQVEAGLLAVTGRADAAAKEMGFVRKIADELGMSVLEASKGFMSLLASIQGTQFSAEDAEGIFENISKAARVMHLSVDDTNGVFRALTQIMSKNSLQSEELRGQLGDRLPGAFSKMAKAMGVSTSKLSDMMKKGQVTGQVLREALIKFAEQFANDTAPGLDKAVQGLQASFGRLSTAFEDFLHIIALSGFQESIQQLTDRLTAFFKSDQGIKFAIQLGRAFKFLADNIETLAKAIGLIIAGGLLKTLIAGFISLGAAIGIGLGPLALITAGIVGLGVALYSLNEAFPTLEKKISDLTDQVKSSNDEFRIHVDLLLHARDTDNEKYKSMLPLTQAMRDQTKAQHELNKAKYNELKIELEKQKQSLNPNDYSNKYEKNNLFWKGMGFGDYDINDPKTVFQARPGSGGRSQVEVLYTESDEYKARIEDYNKAADTLNALGNEIGKTEVELVKFAAGSTRKYGGLPPRKKETTILDDPLEDSGSSKRDLLSQIRSQIEAYEKLRDVRAAALIGPDEVTKAESISNMKNLLDDLERGASNQAKFAAASAEASKMLEQTGISGKDLAEQLVNLGIATDKVKQGTVFDEMNRKLEEATLAASQENDAIRQGTMAYDEFLIRQQALSDLKSADIELSKENLGLHEDYLRALRAEAILKEDLLRDNEIQDENAWLREEIALRAQGLPDLERTLQIERELFDMKNAGSTSEEIDRRRGLLETNQELMIQNDTLKSQFETLKQVGEDLGDAFADAFTRIVLKGESVKEVLSDILMQMAEMAMRSAISGIFSNIFGMFMGGSNINATGAAIAGPNRGLPSALGNAFHHGELMQFARGGAFTNGLVDRPTAFPLGMMGEAGPEAIMPLARGPGGKLGVASSGDGGSTINIVTNVKVEGGSSGNSQEDQKFAEKIGKQVRQATEQQVYQILDKEARPGGRIGPGLR